MRDALPSLLLSFAASACFVSSLSAFVLWRLDEIDSALPRRLVVPFFAAAIALGAFALRARIAEPALDHLVHAVAAAIVPPEPSATRRGVGAGVGALGIIGLALAAFGNTGKGREFGVISGVILVLGAIVAFAPAATPDVNFPDSFAIALFLVAGAAAAGGAIAILAVPLGLADWKDQAGLAIPLLVASAAFAGFGLRHVDTLLSARLLP